MAYTGGMAQSEQPTGTQDEPFWCDPPSDELPRTDPAWVAWFDGLAQPQAEVEG